MADHTVDVALSNLGVVYAARPGRAAAEIRRVLKPTGRALLTAYPADSFNGEVLQLVNRYPTGVASDGSVNPFDRYVTCRIDQDPDPAQP